MSDRLVQQHSGPSRAEHNFHFARRRLASIKLDYRLSRRFMGEVLGSLFRLKVVDSYPTTTTRSTTGRIPMVLRDAEDVHARQRLRVRGNDSIGANHKNAP